MKILLEVGYKAAADLGKHRERLVGLLLARSAQPPRLIPRLPVTARRRRCADAPTPMDASR
jgi:hypothetical protein